MYTVLVLSAEVPRYPLDTFLHHPSRMEVEEIVLLLLKANQCGDIGVEIGEHATHSRKKDAFIRR